jgi:hypothetical protein
VLVVVVVVDVVVVLLVVVVDGGIVVVVVVLVVVQPAVHKPLSNTEIPLALTDLAQIFLLVPATIVPGIVDPVVQST